MYICVFDNKKRKKKKKISVNKLVYFFLNFVICEKKFFGYIVFVSLFFDDVIYFLIF